MEYPVPDIFRLSKDFGISLPTTFIPLFVRSLQLAKYKVSDLDESSFHDTYECRYSSFYFFPSKKIYIETIFFNFTSIKMHNLSRSLERMMFMVVFFNSSLGLLGI